MAASDGKPRPLGATSRHFGRLLLTIGENRIELLAVEMEEQRVRLLQVFLLALAAAVLGLLAGTTLTAALVVLLWPHSHMAALLTLTVLYGTGGVILCRRVMGLRHQPPLAATFDQLRKDRACLEKIFA
jgi:uncharacterized membrane protein YqjE